MEVSGGSNDGPTGDLIKEEMASFGIIPDKYIYKAAGNDNILFTPQTLTRDFSISLFNYHGDTIPPKCTGGTFDQASIEVTQRMCEVGGGTYDPGNRNLGGCGSSIGGFVNDFEECCNEVTSIQNYKIFQRP